MEGAGNVLFPAPSLTEEVKTRGTGLRAEPGSAYFELPITRSRYGAHSGSFANTHR